jgi:hypothetical protein
MQAYHQSFNPAYNNGAVAAVAAFAYYQQLNPNYVIPSQYSMSEGFNYNNNGSNSTVTQGSSTGTGTQVNSAYNSEAYAAVNSAAYYHHHNLSSGNNLPGINSSLYQNHHGNPSANYSSNTGLSNSGLNGSNSPDLLNSNTYPYANSFLNAVHHLHQQTMPASPVNNSSENNSNNNEPSSSSSSSLSSNNSLMPVNSSTPNLTQSSVAVAAAAAAAAAAALQQQSNLYGNSQTYQLNPAATVSMNESQYSNNPSTPTSPHSPKSNSYFINIFIHKIHKIKPPTKNVIDIIRKFRCFKFIALLFRRRF